MCLITLTLPGRRWPPDLMVDTLAFVAGLRALEGSTKTISTSPVSDSDVTSLIDGQLKAPGSAGLLTFCFDRFCLDFWTLSADSEARLSTLPSRVSAGIQQRWNGCLKRTIPSVKGFGLLWNERSCHVTHPPFCLFLRIHCCHLIPYRCRNVLLASAYKSMMADAAWLATNAKIILASVMTAVKIRLTFHIPDASNQSYPEMCFSTACMFLTKMHLKIPQFNVALPICNHYLKPCGNNMIKGCQGLLWQIRLYAVGLQLFVLVHAAG